MESLSELATWAYGEDVSKGLPSYLKEAQKSGKVFGSLGNRGMGADAKIMANEMGRSYKKYGTVHPLSRMVADGAKSNYASVNQTRNKRPLKYI